MPYKIHRKTQHPYLLVLLLGLTSLNSCYFNSAGHLFTKASYKASAKSEDAKPGKKVYFYDSSYYVELPRYRMGKEVLTQYATWHEDKRTEGAQPTGDVTLFRIPADFAMYLTGLASSPSTPSYMIPAKDPDTVKEKGTCYNIVRYGGSSSHSFHYSSPNAAWWYTAGVFDWLCVDLPVTITENALVVAGAAAVGAAAIISGSGTSPSSSNEDNSSANTATYYSSSDSSSTPPRRSYTTYTSRYCSTCSGTGKVSPHHDPVYMGGTNITPYFTLRSTKYECPDCQGTGKIEVAHEHYY